MAISEKNFRQMVDSIIEARNAALAEDLASCNSHYSIANNDFKLWAACQARAIRKFKNNTDDAKAECKVNIAAAKSDAFKILCLNTNPDTTDPYQGFRENSSMSSDEFTKALYDKLNKYFSTSFTYIAIANTNENDNQSACNSPKSDSTVANSADSIHESEISLETITESQPVVQPQSSAPQKKRSFFGRFFCGCQSIETVDPTYGCTEVPEIHKNSSITVAGSTSI